MTAQPNMRSPKTLTELCVDALCRSLADLNGELPPGLPRDVVDDVIASLLRHSALNATTLRVLKHCELETLSLAGCRGVTDLWLEPLKTNSSNNSNTSSSASTPTASPVTFPTQGGDLIDHMDLEEEHGHKEKRDDIYCGSIRHDDSHKLQESPSFGSRSSFVSAAFHTADHLMEIDNLSTGTSRSAADTYDHKQRSTNVSPDTWLACSSLTTSTNNTLTLLDLRGSQNLTDRGLLQLTHLHRLKVARLDHCHSLTGRGLLALSHSHQLHTLSLTHCRRLTDEAVIHIAHLGSSLQTLALDGCRCLTDRALTAMADLHHLLRLDLGQCDLLTDHGLAQLEHLSALQELSLGWCRQITDAGLDCLTQQKGRDQNLRVLILARCHHLTDDGLSYLARLQSLEELNLNGCGRLGSTTLGETLRQLRHLTVLDVSHCPNIV